MSTPNPCLIHFPQKRIVNDEWCCLSLELYTFLSSIFQKTKCCWHLWLALRKFWLALRKSKHEIANGEWCCWPPLAGIEEIKTRNSEWRMAVGTGENAVPKKTGFAHGFTIEWPECIIKTIITQRGLPSLRFLRTHVCLTYRPAGRPANGRP